MSDEQPIWRQALKDSAHPLYKAAWIIFGNKMKVDFADKELAEHKEQVIPFLLEVLQAEELQLVSALGSGEAPSHAAALLGRWRVIDAVPIFISILEEDDWESVLHDQIIQALEDMGPEIFELILSAAERQPLQARLRVTYASILAQAGKRDPRAFDYIATVFGQQKEDDDIAFMAENLLACNSEAGIAVIDDYMRQRKSTKWLRDILARRVVEARRGDFDK